MKVKKIAIIQYLLLYLMLICNQSNFYQIVLSQNDKVIAGMAVSFLVLLAWKVPRKGKRAYILLGVLLLATILTRIISGGIGINFWFEMAIKIEIAFLAIVVDIKHFPTRFVRIVYFFAVLSIFGWILQLIDANLITRLLIPYQTRYYVANYDYSGYRTVQYMLGYGYFFYSYLSSYATKNAGFFTEPGIYQMVINSAIFIILYMSNVLEIGDKEKKKMIVIMFVTVVSIQSTSGYFGLVVIILGLLLAKNTEAKRWKKAIIWIASIGIIVLGADYIIRGNGSILSSVVLNKVIGTDNRFSLSAEGGTGKYRMATIGMSLLAMIKHPLGLGVDGWNSFSASNPLAGAGGWPLKMGAMIGVVPLAFLLYWIIKPLRHLSSWIPKLVLIFLYFNTTLAQSSAFYPALIVIPIWLELMYQNQFQLEENRNKVFINE